MLYVFEINLLRMSDYKRLTKYSEINKDYITPYCDTQNCNGVCRDCDYEQVIVNRLAELEDKIENGTLIELPCKVGEIAYFIIDNERVELHEVVKISYKKNLCGKEKWHISYSEGLFGYNEFELGYRCFVTEVEAKAKLKEINDGK